jgi:preprotein translocase subunit SecE
MDIKRFNLIQYLKDSRQELKKVSWPTKREAWKQTMVVIGMSLAVAIFLGVWDYIFNFALEWYLKI